MTERVAIIEDDPAMGKLLVALLSPYGYACVHFESAETFLNQPEPLNHWSLVLVDWMLPGMSGVELIRELVKQEEAPPSIFVTAVSGEDDLAHALHLGADDYVTKPVNKSVLLARVRAVLRRQHKQRSGITSPGRLMLKPDTLEAIAIQGPSCRLSANQFHLLERLLADEGQAVSREALVQAVWPNAEQTAESRALDLLVSRLRHKLAELPDIDLQIRSLYGAGYIARYD